MYRKQTEFWYVVYSTSAFYLSYLGVLLTVVLDDRSMTIERAIAMSGVGLTLTTALWINMCMYNTQSILSHRNFTQLTYASLLNLVLTTGVMTIFVLSN